MEDYSTLDQHELDAFIDSNFIGENNDSSQRAFLHDALDVGINFHSCPAVRNVPQLCPNTVSFSPAPYTGTTLSSTLTDFAEIAHHSTHFHSPNFLGFPDAGNATCAIGASIVAPLINQNLINQEFCAPKATFIEMETIHWLRNLVGFPVPDKYSAVTEIGGCAVTGGVTSNTIALLAARERMDPGALLRGISVNPQQIRVLVPYGICHYSIRTSLGWLGLGEQNIRQVKVSSNYKIDQCDLRLIIEHERAIGNIIMAVVAYAGDSRTMSCDYLVRISQILKEYNIWFHVDACHGVQLLFSDIYRSRIEGIDTADSVTVDPHKVLWIPYALSYILFRDANNLKHIASSSDLITKTQWSLGQITPFIGSKAFNSLKLWSLIKTFGTRRIGKLIDLRISLSNATRDAILAYPDLVCLNESDINSTMFMWCGNCNLLPALINEINNVIRSEIQAQGKYYIHGFLIPCYNPPFPFSTGDTVQVLRIMNGNPKSNLLHVKNLLTAVNVAGSRLSTMYARICTSFPLDTHRQTILRDLAKLSSLHFPHESCNVVVYGSGACSLKPFTSDIDVMVFTNQDTLHADQIINFKKGIIDLHRRYRMPIDEEVPFYNKLLVTKGDLEAALKGEGFIWCNGRLQVQPVVKTPEFLGSRNMRLRLILNVLTTPVFLLWGRGIDKESHAGFVMLVKGLIGPDALFRNHDEIIHCLLYNGKTTGEMYLGYKDNAFVKAHLKCLLNAALK